MQTTTLLIDFDLSRLSDRMLNVLMTAAGEGERPKTPLVRETYDLLMREKLAREQGQRPKGKGPLRIDLPIEEGDDLTFIVKNLLDDVVRLEFAAMHAPPGTPEHEDLITAAEFVSKIGEAFRRLYRPTQSN